MSGACALAMPIDTAVAAIAREIASATVANNSTPARRRFTFILSEVGEVNPTCPFSAVIIVILAACSRALQQARESVVSCCFKDCCEMPAPHRPDFGEVFEEKRQIRDFG
jgi:hypothetical protein